MTHIFSTTFIDKILHPFRQTAWWLLYRLSSKHKYHLVNTGLKPEYYEIDTRMLYGMFNLLVEYVEVENAHLYTMHDRPGKTHLGRSGQEIGIAAIEWQLEADDNVTPDHRMVWEEIRSLYMWWINERRDNDDPETDESAAYDTMQLIRLVNIRRTLWT